MSIFDSPELYRTIVSNYLGSIIVSDKTGKICFTNQRDDFVLPPEQLLNRNLNDLVKEGFYGQSSTLQALSSKRREIEYIKRKGKSSIVTISVPILDYTGEVQCVIAYSLDETLTYELIQKIEAEKNHVLQVLSYLTNTQNDSSKPIFADRKMQQLIRYAKQVAASDSTVLLSGESGTGKDVLARFIHANSPRSNQVFIPINCAAIPSELLEAEFFGYVKGAYTGANTNGKAGLFELAEKGTLFLDEIGELPLPLQSKLLRVLDSGEVKRIGSEKMQKINVRVLAATNRNLTEMVDNGTFRRDLYYRINVIPIDVPPIRERKDDIVVLAKYFLDKLNQKYSTRKYFAPETNAHLLQYSWPGNVREIKNVVERMYIASPIDMLFLSFPLAQRSMDAKVPGLETGECFTDTLSLREAVRNFENVQIQSALRKSDGNITKAAQELGITRACLYKKISAKKGHKHFQV